MRVALISDLHGQYVALRAVLDEVRDEGVEQVICLGDVATLGPRPIEVIERLRDDGIPCIMGNHDAFLLQPELLRTYTEAPPVVAAVHWCRQLLSDAHFAFIGSFQDTLRVELDGAVLQLYHGTPESHLTDMLATHSSEEIDAFLGDVQGDAFAGGHTHIQMLRQHRGKLVINPGSVGMPFVEYVGGQVPRVMRHAEYAVVEGDGRGLRVSLRRVAVDMDAVRQDVEAVQWPLQSYFRTQYAP